MTLQLEDVNDNAPVFIQTHFEMYIDENESTFPYQFRVEAFDRDLNGKKKKEFIVSFTAHNTINHIRRTDRGRQTYGSSA